MTTDNPFETPDPLSFPPLYNGIAVSGGIDPFDEACAMAALGCDSGTLTHNVTPDTLRAAIVFAPEMPVETAMAVVAACGIGFQNALGALAPPEVAVHLTWTGDIMINVGTCGRIRAAASTSDPAQTPDWLVVGIELLLLPKSDAEAGDAPDQTSLYQEGCGDISPLRLLENWSRHTLVWINRLLEDGPAPLHSEWRGMRHNDRDRRRNHNWRNFRHICWP
jgi:biotin-(acetyl-CoA carboxylase) ligase